MLRTSLNMDYYHDLYDLATNFGVEVEAHRKFTFPTCPAATAGSESARACSKSLVIPRSLTLRLVPL
jgi:hypothetical protein